jgi:hypothetical protein
VCLSLCILCVGPRNAQRQIECGPACQARSCLNKRVREWRELRGEVPRVLALKTEKTGCGLFAGQALKQGASGQRVIDEQL